jgi:hypothetical protein
MTPEEKDLLLRDLCGRLPYGVIVSPVDCGKAILIGIKDGNLLLWDTIHKKEYDKPWDIEYIKPYLRPLSSMTEEEKKEYHKTFRAEPYRSGSGWVYVESIHSFDWLNKKMFDFRGLIPKGLANSTEEFNPYNEDYDSRQF